MSQHGRQFRTNGPNQGFTPASTRPATEPLWITEVGQVGYATPVIGPDNTIYIGTFNDELVAVNPNGTIRWRREITPGHGRRIISASPAVDNDGNIYCVATNAAYVTDHRNSNDAVRDHR